MCFGALRCTWRVIIDRDRLYSAELCRLRFAVILRNIEILKWCAMKTVWMCRNVNAYQRVSNYELAIIGTAGRVG